MSIEDRKSWAESVLDRHSMGLVKTLFFGDAAAAEAVDASADLQFQL